MNARHLKVVVTITATTLKEATSVHAEMDFTSIVTTKHAKVSVLDVLCGWQKTK